MDLARPEDGLFGDAALASLIERTPANAYHVNTMDVTSHDPTTRREGTLEGLSGAEALDAIRNGHTWILLQQPHQLDSRYAEVLRAILRRARGPGRRLQVL